MGLRDEKQRAQREAILANAFAYMSEHQGDLPTITELARASGVSDATVFNYIGQRAALRAEWAHRCLAEACAVAEASGGSLRRILRNARRALRERVEEAPRLWIRMFAQASPVHPALGRPGGPTPGSEHAAGARLVSVARERGEVRGDVDPAVQAAAILSAWLGALAQEARRVSLDGLPGAQGLDEAAWRRVDTTVELVVDGLRRRNERVRLASTRDADRSPGPVPPQGAV